MTFNVALNFEDGVTRVITTNDGETVLDAAYRHQINLPMDCSDGVCGTCKGTCLQGKYDLGDEYMDDALTDEEAEDGRVLTCQMVPKSDIILAIPATSSMCKTGTISVSGSIEKVETLSETSIELVIHLSVPVIFLPGQYVNLEVPGTTETRAYSFSSISGSNSASFLIRNVPGGLMSTYLSENATIGDSISVTGPIGSFYLREVLRPILMLAGGTGLAPLLSMLESLKKSSSKQCIYMLYGVTNKNDLVKLNVLKKFKDDIENFTFDTVVVNSDDDEQRQGFVTNHMDAVPFEVSSADVYSCGPPPMVDAVLSFFKSSGIEPQSFHYEKFNASTPTNEQKA